MALIECSDCKASVSDAALNCLNCGCPIPGSETTISSVRAGVSQAEDNEESLKLFLVQLSLISVVSALHFESWFMGIFTFLGVGALISSSLLGKFLCVALAFASGLAVASTTASLLPIGMEGRIAVFLMFFLGFSISNLQVIEHLEDLNKK